MDLELFTNVPYSRQDLSGGTRASVRFDGSLRLEESLDLLGVPRRGGLYVVGGHLGDGGEMCLHCIRFYAGRANDDDGRVWKRGDQEMGFSFN